MPSKSNILPNLRVDIADFQAHTADFAREGNKLNLERFIIDNRAQIAEGFRIEIADQTTAPGTFTVVNGVSFDRDGQITNNETDLAASRSATLAADATYHLEIEFTESEATVDARAFWDPTFDNGTDTPSGDTLPKGREFDQNVSTRIAPDWRIVTPISTTAFESTATPGSLKIPVAVIVRAGGVITGTTSPLASILTEAVGVTDTTVKLLNTRAMPDASWTLRMDPGGTQQEDVTISANDKENNILTISGGGAANTHVAGERVVVAGGTPEEYLPERQLAFDPILATTGDDRPRFWSGDEARGRLVYLDPDGTLESDRTDTNVESLKRHVDFLAAQLKEMKFGGAINSTKGLLSPGNAPATADRWYDFGGSLVGDRLAITIGDGTTSHGDINTNQFVDDQTALAAAADSIVSGGTIFLKRGTYTMAGITWSLTSKRFRIIGEVPSHLGGPANEVIIDTSGAVSAITASGTNPRVHFENIAFTRSGGSQARSVSVRGEISAKNCSFDSMDARTVGITRGHFENCNFVDTCTSNDSFGFTGIVSNTVFDNCKFQCSGQSIGDIAAEFTGTGSKLDFRNCTYSDAAGATDTNSVVSFENYSEVTFDGYDVTANVSTTGIVFGNSASTKITLRRGHINSLGDSIQFAGADQVVIEDAEFEFPNVFTGLRTSSAGCLDYTLRSINFKQTTTGASGVGITAVADPARWKMYGLTFEDCAAWIETDGLSDSILADSASTNNTTEGLKGIVFTTNSLTRRLKIRNNIFKDFDRDASISVIDAETNSGGTKTIEDLVIDGNSFVNLGSASAGQSSVRAVAISPGTSGTLRNIKVTNNTFDLISGQSATQAVNITDATHVTVHGNQGRLIATTASTTAANYVRIFDCDEITITGNQVKQFGGAGTPVNQAVILVDGDDTTQRNRLVISDNTIDDLNMPGIGFGILVSEAYRGVAIGNNVITPDNNTVRPIQIENPTSNTITAANVSITGNVIYTASSIGIRVSMAGAGGAFSQTGFTITGNTVRDHVSRGIELINSGGIGNELVGYSTVVGNQLFSNASGVDSICLDDWEHCTIVGNTVTHTTGAASTDRCIALLDTCSHITISGNVCSSSSVGAVKGISVTTASTYVAATGNTVELTAAVGGFGIELGAGLVSGTETQYGTGNVVRINTGGGNIAMDAPDNRQFAGNRNADLADPVGTVPVTKDDVGLNIRAVF